MVEYAARRGKLPPPPQVVWSDLAAPRSEGVRAWLGLEDGEVLPTVLEAEAPRRVVWSSLWSDRPGDHVEFMLSPTGRETEVSVAVVGDQAPHPERAAHIRHRLGQLIFRDLRLSYGG